MDDTAGRGGGIKRVNRDSTPVPALNPSSSVQGDATGDGFKKCFPTWYLWRDFNGHFRSVARPACQWGQCNCSSIGRNLELPELQPRKESGNRAKLHWPTY